MAQDRKVCIYAVDSEVDLSGVSVYDMCDTKGYIRFSKNDVFYTMKIDENANKLVKVNEAAEALWITDDGYALSTTFSGEDWKYTVKAPDGKEAGDTLSYTPNGEDDGATVYIAKGDLGESVALFAWKLPGTTVIENPDEPWNATAKHEIYGIKKDGSRELLDTITRARFEDRTGKLSPFASNGENHVAWVDDSDTLCIFTFDDGQIHRLSGVEFDFAQNSSYTIQVFGSKAAILEKSWAGIASGKAWVIDLSGEGKVLFEKGGASSISAIDNGNMYHYGGVGAVPDGLPTFYDSTFKEIKSFGTYNRAALRATICMPLSQATMRMALRVLLLTKT